MTREFEYVGSKHWPVVDVEGPLALRRSRTYLMLIRYVVGLQPI
jgi:hypothetical protein